VRCRYVNTGYLAATARAVAYFARYPERTLFRWALNTLPIIKTWSRSPYRKQHVHSFRLSDFPTFRPIAVNGRTIFFFRHRCEQRGLYCMAVAFLPTTSTSLLALYAVLTAFHSLGALPHLAHSRSTLNLRSLISPDPAMAALPAVLWS
jgi:hypothetical protein